MTSYLIDINVWLSLTWSQHVHTTKAHNWLESLSGTRSRLLFCRITQLGLLRLLTNAQVMGESVVVLGDAFALYDRWIEDPRVEFAMEPGSLESSFRDATAPFARKAASKALMDAYLAGFASAARATMVTFDKALVRIAEQRRIPALLLP